MTSHSVAGVGYPHAVTDAQPSPARRGRPRVTAEESEARRQRLIHAAYEVFLDKGYHQTGVPDITARAQVAVGTYYKAFGNKRDILDPVIDHGVELILAEILKTDVSTEATTFADFEQQLRTIAARIDTAFAERPRLAKFLMFEATTVDDGITQRLQGILELGVALADGYLKNGVRQGFLRGDLATQETARAILGTILVMVMQAAYGIAEPGTNTHYVEAVVALIGVGTAASPKPSPDT